MGVSFVVEVAGSWMEAASLDSRLTSINRSSSFCVHLEKGFPCHSLSLRHSSSASACLRRSSSFFAHFQLVNHLRGESSPPLVLSCRSLL